jgi:hypothetical protein
MLERNQKELKYHKTALSITRLAKGGQELHHPESTTDRHDSRSEGLFDRWIDARLGSTPYSHRRRFSVSTIRGCSAPLETHNVAPR